MTQPSGSQWAVQRRCMAIIRRVQRGGATWEDLAEAVSEQEGDEAYNQLEDEPLKEAIQRDVKRIRDNLNINISYNRAEGVYEYQPDNSKVALLDLPDEALRTIAWLEHTFDEDSPKHSEIDELLQLLRLFLGEQRQAKINRQMIDLAMNLARRDNNHVVVEAKLNLTKALLDKRRVELEYLALDRLNEQPIRHVVDPYQLFFEHGHYYLKGWTHYTVSAEFAQVSQQKYFFYRLDAILRVTLWTSHIPSPPPAKQEKVIYQLSRKLAHRPSRQRWIEIEKTELQPDGTAIVYGKTDAPFYAIQALIRYREECQVLGGPRFLAQMRESVKKMAENYGFI